MRNIIHISHNLKTFTIIPAEINSRNTHLEKNNNKTKHLMQPLNSFCHQKIASCCQVNTEETQRLINSQNLTSLDL